QPQAPRVDVYFRGVRSLEHNVGDLRRPLPPEDVFEAGAAARLDADPQARLTQAAPGQHLVNLIRCVLRNLDHRLRVPSAGLFLISPMRTLSGWPRSSPRAISDSVNVFSTSTMRSLTRHSGSRTLHFENCSQRSSAGPQAVISSGPSIASMMSATEMAV